MDKHDNMRIYIHLYEQSQTHEGFAKKKNALITQKSPPAHRHTQTKCTRAHTHTHTAVALLSWCVNEIEDASITC